jgi:hypothetical protein
MAYGIRVINNSGRTVIDTAQGLSILYATSSGTATGNTDYPTTNYSGTDLIIARPASSAVGSQGRGLARIGRQWDGDWGPGLTAFPTNNNGNGGGYVVWRELKAQSTANLSVGGHGLVVYDGAGTASTNILFSATDLDTTAQLVATGKWNGTSGSGGPEGYYHEFSMDSSLDEGRYYVLVSNAAQQYVSSGGRGNNDRYHVSYEFNYATGKIRMLNYRSVSGNQTAMSTNRDWAILYVINGGSVDDNFS